MSCAWFPTEEAETQYQRAKATWLALIEWGVFRQLPDPVVRVRMNDWVPFQEAWDAGVLAGCKDVTQLQAQIGGLLPIVRDAQAHGFDTRGLTLPTGLDIEHASIPLDVAAEVNQHAPPTPERWPTWVKVTLAVLGISAVGLTLNEALKRIAELRGRR